MVTPLLGKFISNYFPPIVISPNCAISGMSGVDAIRKTAPDQVELYLKGKVVESCPIKTALTDENFALAFNCKKLGLRLYWKDLIVK